MLKNGVITCATGHPYYGRMAYNLALTIKSAEPDVPVAVMRSQYSLAHLSKEQIDIFDYIFDLPDGCPISCGAKLWANDVTPFENTLLLDADMLWLPQKKPSEIFKELEGNDFTAITEGYAPGNLHPKYFLWADEDDIRKTYPISCERLYQWRSEVMYFNKNADKLFEKAREVFISPGLSTEKIYATGTADELGLVVACGMFNVHPHQYKWIPAYWHLMNDGAVPEISQLNNYYLVSFGANHASEASKKLYDKLVKISCMNRGVQHVFPLISKKSFLPERTIM